MMKKRTLGCICGGLLLGAFLYWQNNGLILTKMTYRGEIPAGFDGYKILQIADLQNKVFGRRQEPLLRKIEQSCPDIIVISGDLVDRHENRTDVDGAMEFIHALVTYAPVYFVSGNHEHQSGEWEILEEALVSYTGTVLYVSHDRYFINQTATRIMELTNQAVVNYIGDYDYYLEKKDELTSTYAPGSTSPEAPAEEKTFSENKLSWQQMKEEQAKKRKREAELKKDEARIEELETRDSEIDETMVLPDVCTNVAECTKLSREKAAIAEELEELYEKWEELA